MPSPDGYLHRAASARPYFSEDGESYLARTALREVRKERPLRVLSEEDFAFWQTYGYIVVKEAIPAEAARRLLDFAWDFQGLSPDRPEDWYRERDYRDELDRELHIYGFVEAYHHQLIWDSRQARRVYDAFVDVWDCEEPLGHPRPAQPQPTEHPQPRPRADRAHRPGLRHRTALGRRHHPGHAAPARPGHHRARRHPARPRRLPVRPGAVPPLQRVAGRPGRRPRPDPPGRRPHRVPGGAARVEGR